jgi:hypothetical protein
MGQRILRMSGQLFVEPTPDAMLKAVHDSGFVEERGSLQDHHCRYCDVWLDKAGAHEPESHAEDCLFFQIEAYLKEIGRL